MTDPKIIQMFNRPLETNLEKIEQLASIREDENYRFRSFLKSKERESIDKIVHRLHDIITQKIDCSLCGNCCVKLSPELTPKEIEELARLENITPESYMENYCEINLGDMLLNTLPCRYYKDKKCSLNQNRPEKCKTFPYTRKKGFISRLLGMINFYGVCPIVFNIMEILKDELRFRR